MSDLPSFIIDELCDVIDEFSLKLEKSKQECQELGGAFAPGVALTLETITQFITTTEANISFSTIKLQWFTVWKALRGIDTRRDWRL